MTATTSDTQLNKLQVIQNKALRFIYNIRYPNIVSNQTLHNRAKIPTVKERLNSLRDKQIFKLNLLINDEVGMNAIYKFSDYEIEDEPFNVKSYTLRNMYMRLGMLDDNNEIII